MVRGRARQRERVVMERRSVAVGSKTAGEMLRLAFLCTGGQIRPVWVVLLGRFRGDIKKPSERRGFGPATHGTIGGAFAPPFGLPFAPFWASAVLSRRSSALDRSGFARASQICRPSDFRWHSKGGSFRGVSLLVERRPKTTKSQRKVLDFVTNKSQCTRCVRFSFDFGLNLFEFSVENGSHS